MAVKNQVQLKKLRIAKFIQKWKKKFHCHCHGTTTATEVMKFYFRHCDTTAALPADDLAEYDLNIKNEENAENKG